MTQEKLFDLMRKTESSFAVFYIKLHQHHFYVKGPNFLALHEAFETLYDEVTAHYDEIAERLMMLDGKPYGMMAKYLEESIISEAPYVEKSDKEMLREIVEDLRLFTKHFEEAIELSGELGDSVTEDLYIGYKTSFDKHIWMYQARLGLDATE
ncbi:Dps family protein [Atopobacter phocae]|uniref:Dps family protein n=1 Tax=Atopobacter phocae TaxID=136492 RepID=UPI000472620B|nr:DNA starvation/stationary phase protection protein [Atopobacter phocae]